MNKQFKMVNGQKINTKIEWCDYTWNPIGGCQHGCAWKMPDGKIANCYAEDVANRVAQKAYPHGFEHHYWKPELLSEPLKVTRPSRIFVGSMADVFGHWAPTGEIEQVLEACRLAYWHTFIFLTKNAPRLWHFNGKFPKNVWIGVSVPPTHFMGMELYKAQQARMLEKQLSVLSTIDAPVKWMSVEPLAWDISDHLRGMKLDWAVIGAASDGRRYYQPRREWVENLLKVLDAAGTKVFFKGNLVWDEWREEFPELRARSAMIGESK